MRVSQSGGWVTVALALAGLLLGASGTAAAFTGTVTAVSAGDTLAVRSGGRERPVRLLGLDAPAPDEAFSVPARGRTAGLALGRRVTVITVREDPRGRTVGAVQLPDGRDLGLLLVAEGLARWDREEAPDARGLRDAEAEARAAGRGMWGPSR